jgi:hypothetical protein
MYVSLLLDRRRFIGSGQHAKGAKGERRHSRNTITDHFFSKAAKHKGLVSWTM